MTVVTTAEATDPPAALSAFLRGVERRGLVLAQLQCADEAAAEAALMAAASVFRSRADEAVIALWPLRFWSLLVAAPALRLLPMAGSWQVPFSALGAIGSDDRLALLLRIVGGLDESVAAEVMGTDVPAYQQALARACPRDADGQPDALAWRALAEAAQREVRELPPERLERLRRQREMLGKSSLRAPSTPVGESVAARRKVRPQRQLRWPGLGWRRIALLLAVVVTLVAGGWWWYRYSSAPLANAGGDAVIVRVEELPDDGRLPAPVAAPSIAAADLAMLSDVEFETAREADFYAWVAAGGPLPADESEPRSSAAVPAAAGLEANDDAQ